MSLQSPLFAYYVNMQAELEFEAGRLREWEVKLLATNPTKENIQIVNQAWESFDYRRYQEWKKFYLSDLWQVEELR